jgi:hypothetical protein
MDNECSICLENIDINDLKILSCNHKFHADCINEWIKKKPICPYCRKFLKSFFETKINYYIFKRQCNIFIEEDDFRKVTFVYNYPFSVKPRLIKEISTSKIQSAQIKNNYVTINYFDTNQKMKQTKFLFKNNEADIFIDKIQSLFSKNYHYLSNNAFQINNH